MELVKIRICRDSMEAYFFRQVLEDEDIRATVMGETLGVARGELPMTPETLPSVWVRQDDVERAAQILAKVDASGRARHEETEAGEEKSGVVAGEEPSFEDELPDDLKDEEEAEPASFVSSVAGLVLCWVILGGLTVWVIMTLTVVVTDFFRSPDGGDLLELIARVVMYTVAAVVVLAGLYLVTRGYVRGIKQRRQTQ